MSHELGHIIDFSILVGDARHKDATYTEFGKAQRATDDPSLAFYALSWYDERTRKRNVQQKDFVSGYAMKGIYEDMAESQEAYFNHNLYFSQIAQDNPVLQKKYDFFDDLYGGKYFHKNITPKKAHPSKREWDMTRLSK